MFRKLFAFFDRVSTNYSSPLTCIDEFVISIVVTLILAVFWKQVWAELEWCKISSVIISFFCT